jgi:hypothetical protein
MAHLKILLRQPRPGRTSGWGCPLFLFRRVPALTGEERECKNSAGPLCRGGEGGPAGRRTRLRMKAIIPQLSNHTAEIKPRCGLVQSGFPPLRDIVHALRTVVTLGSFHRSAAQQNRTSGATSAQSASCGLSRGSASTLAALHHARRNALQRRVRRRSSGKEFEKRQPRQLTHEFLWRLIQPRG